MKYSHERAAQATLYDLRTAPVPHSHRSIRESEGSVSVMTETADGWKPTKTIAVGAAPERNDREPRGKVRLRPQRHSDTVSVIYFSITSRSARS